MPQAESGGLATAVYRYEKGRSTRSDLVTKSVFGCLEGEGVFCEALADFSSDFFFGSFTRGGKGH